MSRADQRARTANASTFRVGEQVRFHIGNHVLSGVVAEDRGPLGVGGRHLYRVTVEMDAAHTSEYELSSDELERAA